LNDCWVAHDIRDQVIDFIRKWSESTEISFKRFILWIGITTSKYYNWKNRYGKVNDHNAWIPRDHWLEDWEKEAIIHYYADHPDEGYRRLTFMMLDNDIVAVSPTTVYRILSSEGLLNRWSKAKTSKGTGFVGPTRPHEHWHMDISYLNICGTFFYLLSIIDGYSRHIIHWEIRESMKEYDVEIVLQRAKEKYPNETPRIISDNGSPFIAKDFKEFIRVSGMTHVKTSANYPQGNGKKERWFRTLKEECIRKQVPLSLENAKKLVSEYVDYYNTVRLHSTIGYIAPVDKMLGRERKIFEQRDRKLERARNMRKLNRQKAKSQCQRTITSAKMAVNQ
jgi:putative transposase